jgi:hypothetical protein
MFMDRLYQSVRCWENLAPVLREIHQQQTQSMVAGLLMGQVATAIDRARSLTRPFRVPDNPFTLVCQVEDPATPEEIDHSGVPRTREDVIDLWLATRSATLFVDTNYGQWGLRLLPPDESVARTDESRSLRPREFRGRDIVIGEFIGDLDLLVSTPESVLVAMPLDPRDLWPEVGKDLGSFLDSYLTHDGHKFWEEARSGSAPG